MNNERDYAGITREIHERLKDELRKAQWAVPDGDAGELSGRHGIRWSSQFDAEKAVLHLSILKKPFFIPFDQIWHQVDSAIARVRPS